ncbi:hypothetical protein GmHk_05G012713 [Glycine max]|uniref:Uncharacterized protein n=1 Tax=Glycine max TaxID=3847 RepID=A0A0R0JS41_SOYBN|nr:hypothetical protein GmHk_05G012713 [Glycine max]
MDRCVAAREEHDECGELVEDEGEVPGAIEEGDEVEKVNDEVGGVEVQHDVLEFHVGSGETAIRGGEDGGGGEEHHQSAMEDGNEVAGGFGSGLGTPFAKYDEVAEEVNEEE